MVGYGDRQRLHQDGQLFKIAHPRKNSIVQSTVSKLVTKFRETENVNDMSKFERLKSTTNHHQALDVLLSYMDNLIASTCFK